MPFSGTNFLKDHSLSLLHVPSKSSDSFHKLGNPFTVVTARDCPVAAAFCISSLIIGFYFTVWKREKILSCITQFTRTSLWHTGYKASDSLKIFLFLFFNKFTVKLQKSWYKPQFLGLAAIADHSRQLPLTSGWDHTDNIPQVSFR